MGYNGKLAEWLKASDCKSDSRMRYGGSNPSLTTTASWLIGKAMDCKSITDRFDSYTRLIRKGKTKTQTLRRLQ